MHVDGFVHYDIKPSNILLDIQFGQLTPVITDFGITRVIDQNLQVKAFEAVDINGASMSYAALEVFKRFRNHQSCTDEVLKAGDVYALSISSLQLLCRKNHLWQQQ